MRPGTGLIRLARVCARNYVSRSFSIRLRRRSGSVLLRLTTFGGLALSRDGVTLTGAAAQRSRLSLLALLATAGPTGFSRDKLLLHLWPESDEERARHALKQAVYSLRRELGSDEVIVGTAALSLNPQLITSDAREFEAAIAAGDLATAVSLYTGPFLDGFHLKDSVEYERWSGEQRARFAHLWVSSVEKLAADCEVRSAWREAAGYWRSLAASEPLSGRLALALMKALAESGDLGAALQQYKIHEALLREEIGSAPEAAVSALAESLKTGTWTRSPEPARVSPPPTPAVAAGVPSLQLTGSIPIAPSAPRYSIGSARKRRRLSTALAFVLGGLLVASLGLTITYLSLDEGTRASLSLVLTRPDAEIDARRIVIAPFENNTGEERLDPIGDLVADQLSRYLGDADFKVVDARTARIGSKVVDDIPRPLRAQYHVALGEETGSAYTVGGKYYRAGDSIYANVDVIDVATQQTVKSFGPFYGSPDGLDPFIRQMLQRTIAYLAAEVDTSAGGLTTRYTSAPSIEVQGRVNDAWEHFFVTPRDTVSVFAQLDSAAALDSTYALPMLMKAYMLDVKSAWPGVQALVHRVRPLVPNMSKLEKLAFQLFEADLRGDAFGRLDIARRLQASSPGSAEMPLLRVVSALYIGNVPEALTALKETDPSRGLNLGAPTYLEWAAATYHHSGSEGLEERTVREELKRFRHHPPATFGLARVYAARNDSDLDEVLRRGIPPAKDRHDVRDPVAERFDLHLFAGRELRAHGYEAEAKQIFQRLLDSAAANPTGGVELRRRARVLYELGDYARARTAFQQLFVQDSGDVEALGRIATSSIRLGDATVARQMDDRLKASNRPFLMGAPQRWRAAIASVQGRTDDAVELLETAVRGGHRLLDSPPNLTVHLDADFAGIEKTPAYLAMIERLVEASAGSPAR